MQLDVSSLAVVINSWQEGIDVVSNDQWFNGQSKAVQNTLVAGVIQNFELVYELGIKVLRRRIEWDAASPTEADFSNFRDLLRTAAEKGLIADAQAWFEYRQMRYHTSHTYDRAKAGQVYEGTLRFVGDAKALLQSLEARNA